MAEDLKKSEVKQEPKAEAKTEKAEGKKTAKEEKGFDAFGRKMNADGSFETDKDGNVVREWEWVRSDEK